MLSLTGRNPRLKSIRPHRVSGSRGGTRLRVIVAGEVIRLFALRKDKDRGFNRVATNASGIQSGMMVSIRVVGRDQRTEKTKGGCRWGCFVRDRRSVQTWLDRAASTHGQRYATK